MGRKKQRIKTPKKACWRTIFTLTKHKGKRMTCLERFLAESQRWICDIVGRGKKHEYWAFINGEPDTISNIDLARPAQIAALNSRLPGSILSVERIRRMVHWKMVIASYGKTVPIRRNASAWLRTALKPPSPERRSLLLPYELAYLQVYYHTSIIRSLRRLLDNDASRTIVLTDIFPDFNSPTLGRRTIVDDEGQTQTWLDAITGDEKPVIVAAKILGSVPQCDYGHEKIRKHMCKLREWKGYRQDVDADEQARFILSQPHPRQSLKAHDREFFHSEFFCWTQPDLHLPLYAYKS